MIYLSTLDIPSTHIWDGNISSIGTADTYMGWRRIGHPGDKSVCHETGLKIFPRPNLGQPNPSNIACILAAASTHLTSAPLLRLHFTPQFRCGIHLHKD